jgi:hypothetical protein
MDAKIKFHVYPSQKLNILWKYMQCAAPQALSSVDSLVPCHYDPFTIVELRRSKSIGTDVSMQLRAHVTIF